MKRNGNKCHLVMNLNIPATILIKDSAIKKRYSEKCSVMEFETSLTLDKHLKNIYMKTNSKYT